MNTVGKIIDFDGYTGIILGVDNNKYLILYSDLVDKDVNVGDDVLFSAEVYEDVEVKKYIARFIRKVENY